MAGGPAVQKIAPHWPGPPVYGFADGIYLNAKGDNEKKPGRLISLRSLINDRVAQQNYTQDKIYVHCAWRTPGLEVSLQRRQVESKTIFPNNSPKRAFAFFEYGPKLLTGRRGKRQ